MSDAVTVEGITHRVAVSYREQNRYGSVVYKTSLCGLYNTFNESGEQWSRSVVWCRTLPTEHAFAGEDVDCMACIALGVLR